MKTFEQKPGLIGVAIRAAQGVDVLPFQPAGDTLAANMLFVILCERLESGKLNSGEHVWYGPTNQCRMRFEVSDLSTALPLIQELLNHYMGVNLTAWVYWHDSSESIWRGYCKAFDLLESDFWSVEDAKAFHLAQRAGLVQLEKMYRGLLDKQQGQ